VAYANGVTLDFSRPGKPTDNAFIEAFNGRFRAECLNQHWFMSLEDAQQKVEAWRRYYNEERPHGAIGQKTPIALLVRDGTPSPAVMTKPGNSSPGRSKDGSQSRTVASIMASAKASNRSMAPVLGARSLGEEALDSSQRRKASAHALTTNPTRVV
jgi:hypothetical protein